MIPDGPPLPEVTVTASRIRPSGAVTNTSFTSKQLRTTFFLDPIGGKTTFAAGYNKLQLTGLRTIASIQGTYNFLNQLDLQVYGMTLQDMNALSVIMGWQDNPGTIGKNFVLLEASQNGGVSWTTLFYGLIYEGGPVLQGMPETYFHCQAFPAMYLAGKQPLVNANGVGGLSRPVALPIAQVAQTIASGMGAGLQANGVTGLVPPGYMAGAPLDMLDKLRGAANNSFSYTFDPGNPNGTTGTIALVPAGGSRTQPSGITLTPQSGLVGFPQVQTYGIDVTALFDPALLIGARFSVADSIITAANGTWIPYQMTLQLESLTLGSSQWFASMQCSPAAPA